jgi:hypothetical protein
MSGVMAMGMRLLDFANGRKATGSRHSGYSQQP